MSPSRDDPHLADIFYRRVRLHEPDIVAIKAVSAQEHHTIYGVKELLRNADDEINVIADVIAETQIDAPSSDAVLTVNGYANKEFFKDALMKIDSDNWKSTLQVMLRDGAYIYKAVHQQETVGVAIIIRLSREFSTTTQLPRESSPREVPFPDRFNPKEVKAYAKCRDKDREFMRQLCGHLNSHLRYHGIGKLWGEHPRRCYYLGDVI
ncbi:hypothetical protein SAMD00023353_2500250 [Rosellinia necatrix]|uniref:Uncharacterized protein n=1 Tax=Rosellinia necatrix TaxID=77044 RepID=A0A1S8A7Z8_ROSNE|nr:hypothetical protein SAMD00023353_2500250 [Rosellinia necatrix]